MLFLRSVRLLLEAGSHRAWKIWIFEQTFSSQGKVKGNGNFGQILEKLGKIKYWTNGLEKSGKKKVKGNIFGFGSFKNTKKNCLFAENFSSYLVWSNSFLEPFGLDWKDCFCEQEYCCPGIWWGQQVFCWPSACENGWVTIRWKREFLVKIPFLRRLFRNKEQFVQTASRLSAFHVAWILCVVVFVAWTTVMWFEMCCINIKTKNTKIDSDALKKITGASLILSCNPCDQKTLSSRLATPSKAA